AWRDLIGRAMSAVQRDMPPRQRKILRYGGLAELTVAGRGVGHARGLSQRFRFHRGKRGLQFGLDLQLGRIIKLLATRREELDAIVVMRIVRGTDDDAGIGTQR